MSLNPFTTEILENHPKLTLEVIDSLQPKEIVALVRRVSPALSLRILLPLSHWKCTQVFELLPKATSAAILGKASTDECLQILRRFPKSIRSTLLDTLEANRKKILKAALTYPEDSVGAWMNPAPLSALPEARVDDVLVNLHAVKGLISEKVMHVYIVDKSNNLKGALSISELLQVNPESSLRRLMKKKIKILTPYQSLSLTSSFKEWQEFPSLPVIDPDIGLIGELTQAHLRRAQESIKPRREEVGGKQTSLLWGGLEAGDAFVSGIIELLPKTKEED